MAYSNCHWRSICLAHGRYPRSVPRALSTSLSVICFDEVPDQMVSETRLPLPVRNGIPGRYNFEFRREGTCNPFMFLQLLAGWRHIKVTDQRTKQDFAGCLKNLVETQFPDAEKIRAVLDHLNTHSPAAFYEAFSPMQARYLSKKLELH